MKTRQWNSFKQVEQDSDTITVVLPIDRNKKEGKLRNSRIVRYIQRSRRAEAIEVFQLEGYDLSY